MYVSYSRGFVLSVGEQCCVCVVHSIMGLYVCYKENNVVCDGMVLYVVWWKSLMCGMGVQCVLEPC